MRWLRVALILLWPWLIPVLGPGQLSAADRPNIVVIVADDMGFADVGFQGCRDIPTPHLDALARSGLRCTAGYVSGPYCSPTRAGLLTGRYQQRFGHEFNPGGEAGSGQLGLPTTETTLIERFRQAGYKTGLVGKWHLGNLPKFHPNQRGFAEFFGFLGGAHTYFAADARNIFRNAEVVREPTYLTDALGREAVAFIDRHRTEPFLLEVAFNAVHTPMQATEDRLERFRAAPSPQRRSYAAMLSALDDAVGAITARLREAGLDQKTLIFFLSDNGGPTLLGTTVNGSSNGPLRGSKRTTLDGGIHVPFLVSWPGTIPAGATYDPPVIQLDILPTALVAAGIPLDPVWKLDGVDLMPHLLGRPEAGPAGPHEALYWRFGAQDAIRRGDWKLVRYDAAVDDGSRSRHANTTVTPRRLYNLRDDPGESRDRLAEQPEQARSLLALWETWNRQLVPPLWGPDNDPAR